MTDTTIYFSLLLKRRRALLFYEIHIYKLYKSDYTIPVVFFEKR